MTTEKIICWNYPKTLATLTKAIPISKITYALPFYTITEQQEHKMQSILVRPLRKRLHLPCNTKITAILHEHNIPTITLLQLKLTLQYGTKLLTTSNHNHPAAALFKRDLEQYTPTATFTKRYNAAVNLFFPNPLDTTISITPTLIKRQFPIQQQKQFLNTNTSLTKYKQESKIETYLIYDNNKSMKIRAALRFHRSTLHQHKFPRSINIQPCPLCNAHQDITSHLLLCPQLTNFTNHAAQQLLTRSIHLNVQLLLGDFSTMTKTNYYFIADITSKLLLQYNNKRKLTYK